MTTPSQPSDTDSAIDAARNAISQSLSAMQNVNSALQKSYKRPNSEYKDKFVAWDLSSRNQVAPPRARWSPNAVYPDDLDASKWHSEYDCKYIEGHVDSEVKPAGIVHPPSAKTADSLSWGSHPPILSEYRDQFVPSEVSKPIVEAGGGSRDRAGPNCVYIEYSDPSKWRTEHEVKFVEAQVDNTTKPAGSASEISDKAADSFTWGVHPPVASEYREHFVAPSSEVLPPAVAAVSRERTSPNSVYPEYLDASKWQSELKEKYVKASATEDSNSLAPAGIKPHARIPPPSNFAWSLLDQFAGVEAEDPSILPGGIQSAHRHDAEPQTESSGAFVWPAANESPAHAHGHPAQNKTSPNAVYADAIDPSAWKSEYDARCEDLRSKVRVELARSQQSAAAGVQTLNKVIIAPRNFVWLLLDNDNTNNNHNQDSYFNKNEELGRDSIECEIAAAASSKPSSEYREKFAWHAVDKKGHAVAPPGSMAAIFDHAEPQNWLSEYDHRYAAVAKIPRPSAPVPPDAADDGHEDVASISEQASASVPSTDMQVQPAVAPTSLEDMPPAAEFDVAGDTGNTVTAVAAAVPTLAPAPVPASSTLRVKPEQPSAGVPLDFNMLKRSTKKRYSTEYGSNFSWQDAGNQAQIYVPTSHMDGILYSSLHGSTVDHKEKSSAAVAPAVDTPSTPAVVPSLRSAFTTETSSRFTWPTTSVASPTKAAQKQAEPTIVSASAPVSVPVVRAPPVAKPTEADFSGSMTADSLSVKNIGPTTVGTATIATTSSAAASGISNKQTAAASSSKSVASTITGASVKSPKNHFQDKTKPSSVAWQPKYAGPSQLRAEPCGLPVNRPSSAPARRRHVHTEKRVFQTHDDFNPILMNKRFPGNSDRQLGRWTTETSTNFTWKKQTNALLASTVY